MPNPRSRPSTSQLDLFAIGAVAPSQAAGLIEASRSVAPPCAVKHQTSPSRRVVQVRDPSATKRSSQAALRTIRCTDLPQYEPADQELVDRSIAALPPNRMWFTYKAIRECFGISRATVARKVKAGLVPGIRFEGSRVIEDGAVRRFDRGQLRWLLLAVRSRH